MNGSATLFVVHLALMVLAAMLPLVANVRAHGVALVTAGATLGIGLLLIAFPAAPDAAWPVLDAVSVPRVIVVGLVLIATFGVLPRSQVTRGTIVSLILHKALHLALLATPPGGIAGGLWIATSFSTILSLQDHGARRLAAPYLAASGGLGLIGSLVGGTPGTVLLVLAVLIRMGIFPFQTWLVGAWQRSPLPAIVAVTAPIPGVALIARTPTSLDSHFGIAIAIGLILASILAAALALVQDELPRALALFASSVQALVLLAVLDADEIGHLGGLLTWGVTGISLTGLGLVAGVLQARGASLSLRRHGGLVQSAPTLAAAFLLFGLTAVGAPGTADFASEDLVLHGTLAHQPWLLVGFIGAISLQAYVMLAFFFRLFFGPASERVPDASGRERLALFLVIGLLIATGLAPQLLVESWMGAGGGGVTHQAEKPGETRATARH
jgi:NADH-quinone oxidoreductase subunit M